MPGPIAGYGTDVDTDALYRRIALLETLMSGGAPNISSGLIAEGVLQAGAFNWTPAKLPNISAAIAKARTSPPSSTSALATIDIIGDSTSYSAPLNGGAYLRTNAWARRLAAHLTELGVPALESSFNGAGIFSTTAAMAASEPRLTFGAGWTIQQQLTMGGNFFYAPNGVITPLTWAESSAPFDTIDIEYLKNTAFGAFTADIGGSSLGTTSAAGTLGYGRALISTGAGAATGSYNIKANNTGDIFIFSGRTRNSAARKIEICNFGIPTSTTVSWTGTSLSPYDPLSRIAFRASTATIICLGINDRNGVPPLVPLATYITNMQTLISKCKLTGDCIVVAPVQSNPITYADVVTQQAYDDAAKSLALANDCAFVDLKYRFGLWANANARGLMDDDRHPNAIGADSCGFRIAQLIANL